MTPTSFSLTGQREKYREFYEGMTWDEVPILAIDTETTGFSSTSRIVEIGMVLMDGEEVVDSFQSFLDPGHPMPEDASSVNGITDVMLEGAPKFKDIEGDVLEFLCRGAPWVMHNAPFDMRMLSYDLPVHRWPQVPTLCTLKKARAHGHRKATLDVLAAHYDIEQKEAHRAVDDARVCGLIARHFTRGRLILDTFTKFAHQWDF